MRGQGINHRLNAAPLPAHSLCAAVLHPAQGRGINPCLCGELTLLKASKDAGGFQLAANWQVKHPLRYSRVLIKININGKKYNLILQFCQT